MKEYKARSGASFGDKEAQVIGELINSLKDNEGHVSTRTLLEHGKSEISPLHKHFEWSNTVAAEAYRIHQARQLVNHIVEVRMINKKKVETRAFVSVNDKEVGKVYVTFEQGVTNDDYRKQLLSRALTTLDNLKYIIEEYINYQD